MLLELRVQNLLLIERAELRLGPGLNVITGETGAGKTVLAHALDLLLGGKPRSGIVRPGADEAYVEGAFELRLGCSRPDCRAARAAPGEEEIVLGRRLGSGRSRAFVQGRSATADDLRELGGRLVAFYGQHEHRKLTVASAQLEVLDAFCGAAQLAKREEFAAAHARVRELRAELTELRGRAGNRERDLDLLVFEIGEIEALAPDEAEKDGAAGRARPAAAPRGPARRRAPAGPRRSRPRRTTPRRADAARARRSGSPTRSPASTPSSTASPSACRALRIEAEDLAGELRGYELGLEAEPGRLEQVEERLDGYDRLERKHGGSVEAVLEHLERCRAERERLENAEVSIEGAERALAEAEKREAALAARAVEGAAQGGAGAGRARPRASWRSWRWRTRRSRSSCASARSSRRPAPSRSSS